MFPVNPGWEPLCLGQKMFKSSISTECVQLFSNTNMALLFSTLLHELFAISLIFLGHLMIVAKKWADEAGLSRDYKIVFISDPHPCSGWTCVNSSAWPPGLLTILPLWAFSFREFNLRIKFNRLLSSFVHILYTLHHECFLSGFIDFISLDTSATEAGFFFSFSELTN